MTHPLHFIVPGRLDQLTGGYLYDARMISELRRLKRPVTVHELPGRFPVTDTTARQALESTLAALPNGATVVVDGLALGGMPGGVGDHHRRLRILALVHHPLADETGLDPATRGLLRKRETRALQQVRGVVVTSPFTARRLESMVPSLPPVRAVEPGTDPAEAVPARPETVGNLLCVATLCPRKAQHVLVEALSGLSGLDWHCRMIGSQEREPGYADFLNERIRELELEGRIELAGERGPEEIRKAWQQAGLAVLPSRYEGYGMVITEALARGLPVVTTTGGALVDTLPADAGLAVAPDDVQGLRDALARWLTEPDLREQLRQGAARARETLPGWSRAGRDFSRALDQLAGEPESSRLRNAGR